MLLQENAPFQRHVTGDHLARDEIMTDSEVLEGALCFARPKRQLLRRQTLRDCRLLFEYWALSLLKGRQLTVPS